MKCKIVLFLQAYLILNVQCHDVEGGPCQSAKCILSQLHSEKMQFYAKSESDKSKSLLKEYLDQLRLKPSANLGLTQQSMEQIRKRLQSLKVYNKQNSRETTTRPPPYMYEKGVSTLPPSSLASLVQMYALSTTTKPEIEIPITTASTTSTTTTSTTTTTPPFSMPNFFGALLTASPETEDTIIEDNIFEPAVTDNPFDAVITAESTPAPNVVHHFHHIGNNEEEKPSINIKEWYMKHMSQVLSAGAGASTVALPNPNPSMTTDSSIGVTATSNRNDVKPFFTTTDSSAADFQGGSCPSHCMCTCPQITNFSSNDDLTKKVDLDISLLPCARTAVYQLDLAIKLCRRKKRNSNEN